MKIALIQRRSPSDWVSCQSITRNLAQAWQSAFQNDNAQYFYIEEADTDWETYCTALRLAQFAPDIIAILDHAPFPGRLLQILEKHTPHRLRLVIHVFGDFPLQAPQWQAISDTLIRFQTLFICASEKQRRLVSSFILDGSRCVYPCPFPVDTSEFDLRSEQERMHWRKAMRGEETETVFVYTGRLSFQKNILRLLRSFSAYLRHVDSSARLWLAGAVDDIGVPYLGRPGQMGMMATDMLHILEREVPATLKNRIQYWGEVSQADLVRIYNAADGFISFSVHNDEDFGMAPAEAACCGLPLLLTDWAGYSSFRRVSDNLCKTPVATNGVWLPVSIESNCISVDYDDCVRGMLQLGLLRKDQESRKQLSQKAKDCFSIPAVSVNLKHIIAAAETSPSFPGFSPLFSRVANAFDSYPQSPFRSGSGYSSLYREVYAQYL